MSFWTKPVYETPQQLGEAIERYFKTCESTGEVFFNRAGIPQKVGERKPTPPGLAVFLGFSSYNHMMMEFPPEKVEFRQILRKAISMIEDTLLSDLAVGDKKQAGNIFILKNLGYKDEQHIIQEPNSASGTPSMNPNGYNLSIRLVSPQKQSLEAPVPDQLMEQLGDESVTVPAEVVDGQ